MGVMQEFTREDLAENYPHFTSLGDEDSEAMEDDEDDEDSKDSDAKEKASSTAKNDMFRRNYVVCEVSHTKVIAPYTCSHVDVTPPRAQHYIDYARVRTGACSCSVSAC